MTKLLSDEQIMEFCIEFCHHNVIDFARAIEAAVLEAQGKQEPVGWCRSSELADARWKKQSFNGWTTKYSDVDMALYAAPVVQPDAVLCNFYGVGNFPDLVAAMERHIEKLQAKVPPVCNNWPGRVREG